MKVIDIVLLIPLIFGAYKGYQKGFIMELIQVVALILAIVLGLKLTHLGVFYLKPYIGLDAKYLAVISFVLIFIGTIFLVKWVGTKLKKFAKAVLLGWLDKFMGSVLSLIKWAIAISFIIWAAHNIGIAPKPSVIKDTVIYAFLLQIAPAIIDGFGYVIPYAKDIFEYIKNV